MISSTKKLTSPESKRFLILPSANKDLEDIDGQITQIKTRIDKVEADLKSDTHSNDDSVEDDHHADKDNLLINEKNQEDSENDQSEEGNSKSILYLT